MCVGVVTQETACQRLRGALLEPLKKIGVHPIEKGMEGMRKRRVRGREKEEVFKKGERRREGKRKGG